MTLRRDNDQALSACNAQNRKPIEVGSVSDCGNTQGGKGCLQPFMTAGSVLDIALKYETKVFHDVFLVRRSQP